MKVEIMKYLCACLLLVSYCSAGEFPDLYGVIDLEHPETISDQTFVITSGKSGTHLLLCQIMSITKRPVRTLFPDLRISTNLLNEELDFSKPTIYFGHDQSVLEKCKFNRNKLITTLRNYKEVVLSYLILSNKMNPLNIDSKRLESIFINEILDEKTYFRLYIDRLLFFDSWPSDYKLLIKFEDLVFSPGNFLPQLLSFIGEADCGYGEFLQNFNSFKMNLSAEYSKKEVNIGSREDPYYFRKYIPSEVLYQIDNFVAERYPSLWEKYLKDHAEIQ